MDHDVHVEWNFINYSRMVVRRDNPSWLHAQWTLLCQLSVGVFAIFLSMPVGSVSLVHSLLYMEIGSFKHTLP